MVIDAEGGNKRKTTAVDKRRKEKCCDKWRVNIRDLRNEGLKRKVQSDEKKI